MKAITLNGFGGTENLVLSELPKPVVGESDVLVLVKAISINPVDAKTRKGNALATRLEQEKPLILGWDIAGMIAETGSAVKKLKVGDEVFGMVNFPGHGKAYAEYVSATEGHLVKKPANISFEEAAAGTLAALTAWQGLVHHASIKSGDRVLIHGASGGVGHFAVQIAKEQGAYVIGTSSAKNKDFVLSMGADEHVDYKAQPFESVVKKMDWVFDTIGGDYIDRSLEVLKPGGTIISIVSGMNDDVTEKANARGVIGKRMLVQSSGMDMQALADRFGDGRLKAHVDKVFPLVRMGDAHTQVESGHTVGKLIIEV
ncbi:MAG TPA: NADP-dependent oxidoreductase [Sunxiuqinia sp.]|nr:NADP-dependent oxidoreductase [Sunxiuqinia sp.]